MYLSNVPYVSLCRRRFDKAVVGFDRQPVSRVFGDDDVERALDRFRFCLCPQSSLGALELPASN
jgi:hypothetical protein